MGACHHGEGATRIATGEPGGTPTGGGSRRAPAGEYPGGGRRRDTSPTGRAGVFHGRRRGGGARASKRRPVPSAPPRHRSPPPSPCPLSAHAAETGEREAGGGGRHGNRLAAVGEGHTASRLPPARFISPPQLRCRRWLRRPRAATDDGGFLGGTRAHHRLPGCVRGGEEEQTAGGATPPPTEAPKDLDGGGTGAATTDFLEELERVIASPDMRAVAVADRCVLPFRRLPSSCRVTATDFLEAHERHTASPDAQGVAVADRCMLPFRRLPSSCRAADHRTVATTSILQDSERLPLRCCWCFASVCCRLPGIVWSNKLADGL